jgi:hypothetical protein
MTKVMSGLASNGVVNNHLVGRKDILMAETAGLILLVVCSRRAAFV